MKTLSRTECIVCAIISSTLSSVATLFKVQGVSSVPPVLAATMGVCGAGILSFLYLLIRAQLPSIQSVRKVIVPLMMLTFCRPVFSNVLFTIGLSMTSGIKAVFLTKMEPYLVIFWVWILDGKRPSVRHLGLLVVHIVGAIVLSTGSKLFSTDGAKAVEWGDLIIVSAAITAALSYRYAPRVTKVLSPIQTSTISETMGGLLTIPLALLLYPLEWGPAQQAGWVYVAVHAVLFYVLAVPLLYASLHGIEGWLSSTLRATGPLVAVPVGWFFFGERLEPIQMLGAGIVLYTSALISRAEKKS